MAERRARAVLLGGFLGAGKTTAVLRLAHTLTARGLRVGLITNDQSSGLVDTAMLRAGGFAVAEVAGGCFCCRFDSLLAAAAQLAADQRPDVFIAEPVGSCTDLVATVANPLRKLYGEAYAVAPLSVLVDPVRARRALGLERGRSFSGRVLYVYVKQLEEADLIVVNKRDLLPQSALEELCAALRREFPRADVLAVSARRGDGLEAWFQRLLDEQQPVAPVMDVDYDLYAEGEALLGWLNATLFLAARAPCDGNGLLAGLAGLLTAAARERDWELAHLKMTLEPEGGVGSLGILNVTRSDAVPELVRPLTAPLVAGQLTLNLRAEADATDLRAALERALDQLRAAAPALTLTLEHCEHFQPARPVPTHRIAAL